MSVKYADAARNAMLDALSTTYGANAKLRIYSGAEPTDEGTALSGNTLLAEFTLDPASASGGIKNFVPSTLSQAALASGEASFYRIYNSAGSTCYEQGNVGETGDGNTNDLELDNTDINVGQMVNITAFNKTAPG